MKYLLIAEKPSLMQSIRSCYKDNQKEIKNKVGNIDFIALSGHVCRECLPDAYSQWKGQPWEDVQYPMVPEHWKTEAIHGKKKILQDIKSKANLYDGFIVATDSDTEGYGIYYLLETYLNLQTKKALRFVYHSLTDQEILKSLFSMTDIHQDPVHTRFTESYLLRSHADWLFGMNASRIMSVKLGKRMRVGRVKAPTIKLIYDNSHTIQNFVSEKYYEDIADYGSFTTALCSPDRTYIHFKTKEEISSCPLDGKVVEVDKTKHTVHAPQLFDLTSAQVEAGHLYGYTPAKTLDIIQSLYEKHKVLSYPRTECRAVSSEKAKEFPAIIPLANVFPDLSRIVQKISDNDCQKISKNTRVVNDKEVAKESHDALLPTSKRPELDKMTEEEKNIYHMVMLRLLLQFLPDGMDAKTKVTIQHGNELFAANGTAVIIEGWREAESMSDKPKTKQNCSSDILPDLHKGDRIKAKKITPVLKKTQPPKRLTQTSLLSSMQNIANSIQDPELRKSLHDSKGIGTPATRTTIISDILKSGYAERKGRGLAITSLGETYVKNLQGFSIVSPEFTANIDTEIKRVQRGEADYRSVYQKILQELTAMCEKMEKMEPIESEQETQVSKLPCPVCGENMEEQKFSYVCSACSFKINKKIAGKTVSQTMLRDLGKEKKTKRYTFKNKEGKEFQARLVLQDNGIKFDFTTDLTCPMCGKDMQLNRGGAFCDCGFKVFRKEFGTELSDEQIRTLIEKKETDNIQFISKRTGREYTGYLSLDEDRNVKMNFPEA